jgi:hypothetical protein
MKQPRSADETLGRELPGPAGRLALRLLIPAFRREELVGDLLEEAEIVVLPSRGRRAARRWFWRQALLSASPLYARRMTKGMNMNRWRWLVVAVLLIAGPLMALDGGLLEGSALVIGTVALAVAIPAAAGLLSGNLRTHAGAAIISAMLLLGARVASGIELRWYAMGFIFFVILQINWRLERRLERSATS